MTECAAPRRRVCWRADTVNRARLLASVTPGAGSWMQSLPCTNLGLRLGREELRIAIGLWLGAPLVRAHRCAGCGTEVGQNGHHGLACRRSAGRHRRHALSNDVMPRAIRFVDVHAELEPSRLLRDDGKRHDGVTFDPWHRGRYQVWDFTCPDTLAPSHLFHSSTATGSAAVAAEAKKLAKYQGLLRSDDYTFVPIAIETRGLGPISSCAVHGNRRHGFRRAPGTCAQTFPSPEAGHRRTEGQCGCSCRNTTHGRHLARVGCPSTDKRGFLFYFSILVSYLHSLV